MDHLMISADDHLDLQYLPPDLWTERLPRALRERAPHVEDRGEEGEFWVCDGETWTERRGARWAERPNRVRIALDRVGVADPTRPVTAEKRLADMARDGVYASVMFPPIVPMQVGDAGLRNATVRAYNDWAVEFRATAPGRFLPIAMLSPLDPA